AEILDPDKDQLRTPRDVDAARFVIAGQMFPYFFHDVNPVFAFLQICDRGPSALPGFGEFSAEDAVRTLAARIGRDAATVRAAFPPVDAYLALETAEGRRTVTLDMKAYLSAFFHSLRALVPSDRADLLREMGGGGDEIGQYLQIATIEADDRFSELRLSISAKDGGGSAPTTMTYELRDGLFLLLSQLVHAPDDSKGGEDKPDAFEAVTSYEYVTVHGVALPSKFTIVARSLKGGRVLKQTTSFGLAFSEHRVDSPPPDEAFDAFDRLYGTIRKEQFAEMRERIRKMKETNPDWSAADAEKRLREEEEKPPKRWNPWR
ncbi:MAG: hypothetical protein HYY17_10980, partial [Planctomycetes bacterium]|nr:hypothetical protein [Planctomycetota bacterium]